MLNPSSRRGLILPVLLVAAATLACIGSAHSDDPLAAADFVTVTPGGRVSISLLTPTLTGEDAGPAPGTPIGAVGTATAQAAEAAAQTATAAAPTATPLGIFSEPAECPPEGTPSLPDEAPPFSQFNETIARFLSQGGAPTVLEGRLRSWGALADYGGLVRADRDFTGDGVPEVLTIVLDPQNQEFPYPGDMYIFGCDEGSYRLLYQVGSSLNRSAPIIVSYNDNDVNRNQLNDLVYAVQDCTDVTCQTVVEIIEWSLSLDSFHSLLETEISAQAAEVQVTDLEEDGLSEVIVTSGKVLTPAAGPQRETVTTLRWNGEVFAVSDVTTAPAVYRIHVIHEGDEALRDGDPAAAIALYRRAATDTTLENWRYPEEEGFLTAFARLRLITTYAAEGDAAAAQAAYDELMAIYAAPVLPPTATPAEGEGGQDENSEEATATPLILPTQPLTLLSQPGGGFAEMARLFWRDYAVNRDVAAACETVTAYAASAPSTWDILNSFGYANPTYTFADICRPVQ
jgi:hypothetical protein